MVRRPACVRSGPNTPLAGVPRTAWQVMHASEWKSWYPARAATRRGRGTLGHPALELVARMNDDQE
jgi:hypothetical protein